MEKTVEEVELVEAVKVIYIAARAVKCGGDVAEGGVDYTDLIYVKDIIDLVTLAGEIDVQKLVSESKSLDKGKVLELLALYNEDFEIPQKDVEKWIEQSLEDGVDVYYAVKKLVDNQKKFFSKE